MSSWISEVVDEHAENEAPERFFYWAAITAIAATVRKNVWLNRHYYKQYPNIYTFIVAKSGMKKGIPVTLAKSLVTKADATRIISGRNSMQRIIADLGKACPLNSGGMVKEAHTLILSGELAAFFVKDPDAMTILTDLFNTHEHEDKWTNSLKGTGVDTLKAPCLTLMGATNEDLFPDAVSSKDTKGGFIARTFIVYSADASVINPLTEAPKKIPDTDRLSCYLKELAKLHGEFKWTPGAKALYDPWYIDNMTRLRKGEINDPTGTYARLGDQVLKLAMCLSLAQDFSLELRREHIFEAITEADICCQGMKTVTMGYGRATLASQTRLVMKVMLEQPNHQISRKQLLGRFWGEFDAFDMDRIAETLIGAGAIKVVGPANNVTYQLTQNVLDMYLNFKKGII